MSKTNFNFFVSFLFITIAFSSEAQHRVVGKVISPLTLLPIPGVSILNSESLKVTKTDENGRFDFETAHDRVSLIFEKSGYITLEYLSADLSDAMIEMEEVSTFSHYAGEVSHTDLAGNYDKLNGTSITHPFASSDANLALQGAIPGVSVGRSDGAPDTFSDIKIRGFSAPVERTTHPLFIVDDIVFDVNPEIPPEEIESIQILKPGAATAIYGFRGRSGVVLIKTKTGQPKRVNVSYDTYYGVQQYDNKLQLASTIEQIVISDIIELELTGNQTPIIELNGREILNNNTNWVEENDHQNAKIRSHSVQLNGGYENWNYHVTATSFDQEAVWGPGNYDKESIRLKSSYQFWKIKAFGSLAYHEGERRIAPDGLMQSAIFQRPWISNPEFVSSNTVIIPYSNPQNFGNYLNIVRSTKTGETSQFSGNIGAELEILKGLKLKANYSRWIRKSNSLLVEPALLVLDRNQRNEILSTREETSYSSQADELEKKNQEYSISYMKSLPKNDFFLGLGYTIEKSNFFSQTENINMRPDETTKSIIGWFNYSYDSKYIASMGFRTNASEKNIGYSLAWNVSKESFFSSLRPFVNHSTLSINLSSGHQNAPSPVRGFFILQDIRSDFSSFDIQFKTQVMNSGLYLSASYYQNKYNEPIRLSLEPRVFTISNRTPAFVYPSVDIKNRGMELRIDYRKQVNDWLFSISGNLSKNRNEIASIPEGLHSLIGGELENQNNSLFLTKLNTEGDALGSFNLIPSEGVIKTQEELEAYQVIVPSARLGDLRYVDVNRDGVIDDDDRINAGKSDPDFEYGFQLSVKWKGLDLSARFHGVQGVEVYNGSRKLAFANARHVELLNQWWAINPTSDIPTHRFNPTHPNFQSRSTQFLEDASYLRVQDVTLGYTFSVPVLEQLRVYISAQNPVVWTKYKGNDPETSSPDPFQDGIDNGGVPVPSIYRMGLNARF